VAFVLHPGFPAVDAILHTHRLAAFMEGELVSNLASISETQPTPIWLPYPPLAYAVLSGVPGAGQSVEITRVATAIFEGTAPVLLYALGRVAGATSAMAGRATIAGAVMPEGLLIVAKGVTANAVGSWIALCALLSLVRRRSIALTGGLMILAFLGHVGSAAGLASLLVLWRLWEWRRPASAPPAPAILASLVIGVLGAWLCYYREAWPLARQGLAILETDMQASVANIFAVRGVHIGKILQNLVLKFGLFVPVAWIGIRAAPEPLRRILWAWLGAAGVLGLSAILTPFALRFEYFAAPAVALAAGCGVDRISEGSWRLCVITTFLLQIILGIALLFGSFDIINVIIPSPRWWLKL
jgi:hypothetical protein